MSRVIFVRHGETAFNTEARYSGQTDTQLTDLGHAQHAAIVERLREESVDRIVSSDLTRALSLGHMLSESHKSPVEPTSQLREMSFGDWEGLTYDEAMALDRSRMVAFNRDTCNVAPPDGETLVGVSRRAVTYFKDILRAHKTSPHTLIVVSHSGTIGALLCELLSLPLERYWTLQLDNGSLTILDTFPMGSIVKVLNDTCHLPKLLV